MHIKWRLQLKYTLTYISAYVLTTMNSHRQKRHSENNTSDLNL